MSLRECGTLKQGSAYYLYSALDRLLKAIEADYKGVPDWSIRSFWETNGQAIDAARAALKKARGEKP